MQNQPTPDHKAREIIDKLFHGHSTLKQQAIELYRQKETAEYEAKLKKQVADNGACFSNGRFSSY